MNAQIKPASYGDLVTELQYERKRNESLEKRIKATLAQNKKYGVEVSTLRQKVDILRSKMEKEGISIQDGVSEHDEKKIIASELVWYVKNRKDSWNIAQLVIRLYSVDPFWRSLKNKRLDDIAKKFELLLEPRELESEMQKFGITNF